MKERKQTLTIEQNETPPLKGEPERQLGGPQSGFPPPFVIGQELAPYLIVGINSMYDQINNLCNRSHSIHAAGAVALSKLASWLGSLKTLSDLSPKLEELHQHILAIGCHSD